MSISSFGYKVVGRFNSTLNLTIHLENHCKLKYEIHMHALFIWNEIKRTVLFLKLLISILQTQPSVCVIL